MRLPLELKVFEFFDGCNYDLIAARTRKEAKSLMWDIIGDQVKYKIVELSATELKKTNAYKLLLRELKTTNKISFIFASKHE